ncbi:UDP-N-acetylmuramoyl-L-alanine--D-glutamate ligase [Alienimonas chondri]|uniref:UDP-N-acetylmuramoylalanine--D-glutamate ligase n=1 Tax=Alienimonas chondri TaxID=2681879 RepID=A0ABX1VIL8_9PLAN|nr:UDP-N-acetylmuramoyl-L-alanine--D-glutamate ligase [Alienimonas chondri]NNJ27969.1 UDP-N-acetylmuramoylalanine--D-glutamate ligase [Alienimonas chondri]
MNAPAIASGSSVTVMGLGTHGGGAGAVRYLCREGANVTLTDRRTAEELAEPLKTLGCEPAILKLGGHDVADFMTADLIVASPAIPYDHDLLRAARSAGVPVTTELALAAAALPPNVATAAVTGSNGKSTSCALLHAMLSAKHARTGGAAWLAGNGGGSLLDEIERVRPGDSVVWEVSSFQLEYLVENGFRADVAVVTNFAANHLDRHRTLAAYRTAKQGLLENLRPTDTAILNAADADVRIWPTAARRVLFDERSIPLPGAHNAQNAAAAEAAALALGCSPDDVEAGLKNATLPPHRLQLVAERDGVRFVDDSAATTPESLIAALHATPGPIYMIAGGADKGADLQAAAAAAIADRTAGAYFIGATASAWRAAVLKVAPDHRCFNSITLDAAFAAALQDAQHTGGAILLSPGCSSLDQFESFEARGAAFARLAHRQLRPHARAADAS